MSYGYLGVPLDHGRQVVVGLVLVDELTGRRWRVVEVWRCPPWETNAQATVEPYRPGTPEREAPAERVIWAVHALVHARDRHRRRMTGVVRPEHLALTGRQWDTPTGPGP